MALQSTEADAPVSGSLPAVPERWKHQEVELARSAHREYWGLFWEMGTGKSRTAIDHATAQLEAGVIDAVLVIAPKGAYRNWTDEELPKFLPPHAMQHVAHWAATPSKAERDAVDACLVPGKGFVWLAMNVEALSYSRGVAFASAFLHAHRAMIVVDESTAIKNRNAQRTRALLGLRSLSRSRRILTGTPVTKSPLDLYAQCLFLHPDALGFKSYYAFRATFAQMETVEIERYDPKQRRRVKRKVQKVVGFKNMDQLKALLARFSSRVMKSECLDLPPKVYERRTVEMGREQASAYRAMRDQARVELEGMERVTAQIALSKMLRLHQIACGVMGDEALWEERVDALLGVLAETEGKAIVWATYRPNVEQIVERLGREYGRDSVVGYYGGTPADERPRVVKAFQREDGPRFFVGNQQTGGRALTLTAASTVVFFSNAFFDLELRLQAEDRAHRGGQTRSVTYVDLVAPGTIDERMLSVLRGKDALARTVLGDAWREWI